MATKHPAPKGAQRRAFEQIGAGNASPMMTNSTRDALLRKGLIEEIEPAVLGGRFPVTIRQFRIPIPVHVQWCEWCDENIQTLTPAPQREGE